jgi:hypothetical protein
MGPVTGVMGELDTVGEINWNKSPFFLFNYFENLEGKFTRCKMCPNKFEPIPGAKKQPKGIVPTLDGNTQCLKSHLYTHHKPFIADFEKKKEEVIKKRLELKQEKDVRKRRTSGEMNDTGVKQLKLTSRAGLLTVNLLAEDLAFQKEWDNAMSDFLTQTQTSFNTMSGISFKKLIEVLNKRSRTKIKVKGRKALSNGISVRAEEIVKQVLFHFSLILQTSPFSFILLLQVCVVIKVCMPDMKSVGFTTDLWTSLAMDAFICHTVHFIYRQTW